MLKKYFTLFVFLFIGVGNLLAGNCGIKDSVGVKKQSNGTMLILHKVESGETLWALYRKYQKQGATVDGIKKGNGGKSQFKVGQTVNIPTTKKYKTTSNAPKIVTTSVKPKATDKVYVVKAGETLYAISKKTKASVGDIKKWNKLNGNSVSVGQKLIVGKGKTSRPVNNTNNTTTTPKTTTPVSTSEKTITHKVIVGETLYAIARKYNVSVGTLKKLNPNIEKGLSVGAIVLIKKGSQSVHADGSVHEEITTTDIHHKKVYTGYEKVVQEGTVKLTNRQDFDDKFSYVFHKTIPYGVIVTIVNPKTGEYTYARVIGKLSNASPNLIEVSKTVWQTLKLSGTPAIKISYVL